MTEILIAISICMTVLTISDSHSLHEKNCRTKYFRNFVPVNHGVKCIVSIPYATVKKTYCPFGHAKLNLYKLYSFVMRYMSNCKYLSAGFNLLAFFFLSAILTGLLRGLLSDYLSLQLMGVRINYLCGFASTVFTIWFMMRFVNKRPFSVIGLSLRNHFHSFVSGIMWAVAIYSGGFAFLAVSNQVNINAIRFDGRSLLLSFIFYLVVAVKEEITYRGYCINVLTTSMNKYAAVVISSAIFVFFHRNNAGISYLSYFNLFLVGILFSVNYVHTRNLSFSIALHWFWNWIQGPVLGFGVSGSHDMRSLFRLAYPNGDNLLNGGTFGFEASVVCTVLCLVGSAALITQASCPSILRKAYHKVRKRHFR